MATREQIMQALLLLLQNCGDFVTVSRRNRSPESIGPAESPALFLLEDSEIYVRPSQSLPAVRKLKVSAIFYNSVASDDYNTIPATAVNNALDQLDIQLAPDSPVYNTFTLGGLVKSVMIDGEIVKSPGDVTGDSLAVVPIQIEIP